MVLPGWRGRPHHRNEQLPLTESLLCTGAFLGPLSPHIPNLHVEKLSPNPAATALAAAGGQRNECYFRLGAITEGFPEVVTYKFESQAGFGWTKICEKGFPTAVRAPV